MNDQELINLVTQVGIIPVLFGYTLVKVKSSLDANTKIMTMLYEKLGGADKHE